MLKIAIDAMGGDDAPKVVIEGAVTAALDFGHRLILVGRGDLVSDALTKRFRTLSASSRTRAEGLIDIKEASQVVEMHEPAVASVRQKRDSSINVGIDLLKSGDADAFVSAGNTGAMVAAATLTLKTLQGVDRPGIAVVLPTLLEPAVLIDAGANIDPKPLQILQYGIMGDVYSRHVLGRESPRVGLLNIGEEETKGTGFVKETFSLLKDSRLNFVGNIEGRDVFMGNVDVIVCDGFVGNVVLKVSESLGEAVLALLAEGLSANPVTRLGALLSRSALKSVKTQMDYSEYGGALLLGVNGCCVIGHGGSSRKAVRNAVKVAAESVEHHLADYIIDGVRDG